MYQNEPVFVVEVHEILDGVDIAKRDRLIPAKSLPVVQGVAVVAEDRRPLEQLTGPAKRGRKVCGQHRCWFLTHLVDVCRGKEAHADIVEPEFWQVLGVSTILRPQRDLKRSRIAAE